MEIQNGKTYRIKSGQFKDSEYWVEDLWQNIPGYDGKSWMFCDGNMACIEYALRSGKEGLPMDNNVYYGKIGPFGKLIHANQIGEEVRK